MKPIKRRGKRTSGNLKQINMKKFILCLMVLLTGFVFSQKKRCWTDEILKYRIENNPQILSYKQSQEGLLQQMINKMGKKRLNVTFPVVVHVLYNKEDENISDAQIQSQIDALNRDFNKLNSDTLKSDHPFYPLVGNVNFHFELAKYDEKGNSTNGITRTKVSKVSWGDQDLKMDNVKFSSDGGVDNWNPNRFLNIYSVRFADSVKLLGYAFFPDELVKYPSNDGVVIDFRCFGTNGTAGIEGFDAYKLGRTVTHEVGHWLGLNHIWGDLVYETDEKCGDDLVDDTPPAEGDNSGVPTFPHRPNNKCGSNANGEMYMNYMDYVYDKAMVMFSKGQVSRMNSAILTYRNSFVNKVELDNLAKNEFEIIKTNPIKNIIELNDQFTGIGYLEIYDMVGKKCWSQKTSINEKIYDVSNLYTGEYIIVLSNENNYYRTKFIKL
jgi:hypothetical protein